MPVPKTKENPVTEDPKIDATLFRTALGNYASGVTVISGLCDDTPVGFTCQSFYSVSLDPPLVSFSVRKASNSWPKIRNTGQFTVNVLDWRQIDISNGFAKPAADRWKDIDWTPGVLGDPLIRDALMSVECRFYAEHDAGDHTIVLGWVVNFTHSPDDAEASPLVYFRGSYRQLAGH